MLIANHSRTPLVRNRPAARTRISRTLLSKRRMNQNNALFTTRAVTRMEFTLSEGVVKVRVGMSYQPNSTSASLITTSSVVALFLLATSRALAITAALPLVNSTTELNAAASAAF